MEVDPSAPRKKYNNTQQQSSKPHTHRAIISQFIEQEFGDVCRDYSILPGSIIHLAVSNKGVEITVNGRNLPYRVEDFDQNMPLLPLNHNEFSNVKSFCKTRGFTQKTRIFYSENYVLGDALKMTPVLGDDAFLQSSSVAKAFNAVAKAKGWQTQISKVELSEVSFSGVEFKAWTAVMLDCKNVEHKMACLICNGIIVPDYDGDIIPFKLKQGILTERDVRFRVCEIPATFLERIR